MRVSYASRPCLVRIYLVRISCVFRAHLMRISCLSQESLGSREKDELLQKLEELQNITADTDKLTLQLKRRVA